MSLEILFGSKEALSSGQEVARALLIFVYGIAIVRLAGRRIFGKWAALDLIVSLIIGSNLSRALTGNAPLWGTLAASTVLMAVHWLMGHAVARFAWASHLLEGRPISLAPGGTLDERRRKAHSVSVADLGQALRLKGLGSLEEAGDVILEPSGRLNAVARSDASRAHISEGPRVL